MDVCDSVDADDRDILEASAALKDITKNVNTFISQQEKVRAARLPPGNTPLGAALGRVPAQGSDDGGCKKSPMPHVAAENASSRRVRRLFRARAREFPRRFGRSVLDAPPFFLLIVPDIPPPRPRAQKNDSGPDDVPGVKDLHQMQDRIAALLSDFENAAASAEAK